MKKYLLGLAMVMLLIEGAASQSIHPPTREGFGAKPDPSASQPTEGNNPEAQGGADSKQNRDYGKETKPEGKELHEGQPVAPKP